MSERNDIQAIKTVTKPFLDKNFFVAHEKFGYYATVSDDYSEIEWGRNSAPNLNDYRIKWTASVKDQRIVITSSREQYLKQPKYTHDEPHGTTRHWIRHKMWFKQGEETWDASEMEERFKAELGRMSGNEKATGWLLSIVLPVAFTAATLNQLPDRLNENDTQIVYLAPISSLE